MSERRVVNEKTGGEKGTKAERFELLPWDQLAKVARHYAIGAEKYAANNWRRGYDWSLSFGAMQRHLAAFWSGDDVDEETGSPHLAAAVFHCFALMLFMDEYPELDDRPSTALAKANRLTASIHLNREEGI